MRFLKHLPTIAAAIIAAFFCSSCAVAQNQYFQMSGNQTPGHLPSIVTNNVGQDAGTPLNPYANALGFYNGGNCPLGISSNPYPGIPAAGAQYGILTFCITNTAATIAVTPYGGLSAIPFYININGTSYPFPGSGSGDVVGPSSSTSGDAVIFNGTTGKLIADAGAPPLLLSGGTMTGKLITEESSTSNAGLNLPQGAAPTSPVNGDMWATSLGFFGEINGAVVGPFGSGGGGSSGGQTGVTPLTYGAKCDSSTDDSTALQNWLNAGAAGTVLALTKSTCLFKTPLSLTNPMFLTIIGAGPYQSVLLYAGSSTTSDLISIGAVDPGTQTSDMFLSNFRVTSNTQMTAGAGIHFKNIHQSMLWNVTADGQGGTGNLWKGIWFDQVDNVQYIGVQAYAQNDGVAVDGDTASGGAKADLWLYFGKIQTSTNGIHVGGAFGGLYVDGIDVIGNSVNLLIDTALASQGNREIFIGPNVTLDSAGVDNIQVNDTLTDGATLKLAGWSASAARYGLNVISWPDSIIDIIGGPIFNNGSDGIHVSDLTSFINISAAVHINANSGYGINASGAYAIYADPSSFTDTASPNGDGPWNTSEVTVSNGVNGWQLNSFPNFNMAKTCSGCTSGIQVFNNETASSTMAELNLMTGTTNAFVALTQADGTSPVATLLSGAGNTQLTIQSNNGPIVVDPNTFLVIDGVSGCLSANSSSHEISGNGTNCGPGSAGMSLTATDQDLSGGVNLTPYSIGTVSSGTTTIDCGKNPGQYLTNNGAFTLAAPSNDGECTVQVINGASAGAITFSGFSEGSNTGDPLNTTSGDKFDIVISRINSNSHYLITALQ